MKEFNSIVKDFLQSYAEKDDSVSNKDWLKQKLAEKAVDMTQEALEKYAQELVGGVESYSGTLDSLNTAAAEGKTAETWLEDKVKESGKTLSNGEIAAVDEALKSSNTRLLREMKAEENLKTTGKTAESLTAEQMCIDDFNNNAAKENSRYEASVDNASVASVYGRNLFDVVIKDKFTGKKLENYQIKYGDTVAETIDMIAASDVAGQKFVVPQEMLEEVQKALPGKEILSQIGGSKLVNIASNPISKALVTKFLNGDIVADVKQLTSDPKEVLKNIAGNAVTSGVIASGFLGGLEKLANNEPTSDFKGKEIIAQALASGNAEGIKVAAAGALATCVQNGVMKTLPKNTPAIVISSLASAGIENFKLINHVDNNRLTLRHAMERLGYMYLAMSFEFAWGRYATKLAAQALNFIPVIGPALNIAVTAGVLPFVKAPVKAVVVQTAKRVATVAKSVVKSVYNTVKSVAVSIKEKIYSFFS